MKWLNVHSVKRSRMTYYLYVEIFLFIFIQIEYYIKTYFYSKMIFYSKLIGKCGLDLIKKHTVAFHEICFIRQLQKRMENCPMKSIFDTNFSEKEITDMNFAMYPEHRVCSSQIQRWC